MSTDRRLRIGRLQLYVEPRDLWIGVFVAPTAIYVCPLPAVVLKWPRRATTDRVADEAWSIVERSTRAKVAAELRAALIAGERPPWAVVGNPVRAASVAEWAARIAEGDIDVG